MRIQSVMHGGFAEVSDELGERLIASGSWRKPRKPRTTKTKTAPDEEPKTEE